jgi:hypothetical protein
MGAALPQTKFIAKRMMAGRRVRKIIFIALRLRNLAKAKKIKG